MGVKTNWGEQLPGFPRSPWLRDYMVDNMVVVIFKLTEDLTKAKEGPPEFRVQMHDITTNVGEPATFDCHVSGFPRPEVFWTKASL